MKRITKCIVVFITLVLATVCLGKPVYILTVKDADAQSILLTRKVDPGFEFATLIRHSVQTTPVYEYYRVEKDKTLTVVRTELQDLGWGMPSTLNHKVEFKNNYMIMDKIDRNLKFLPFRVNHIAKPCIIIDNKKIDLTKHVKNDGLIHVYVQKTPNIRYILRGNINVFKK